MCPSPGTVRSGWIDLHLASMGYLRALDGRYRHVPGLDPIAAELLRLGARARWDEPVGSESACVYLCSRVLILAPALFEQPGWLIRGAVTHELLHLLYGRSEQRILVLAATLESEEASCSSI